MDESASVMSQIRDMDPWSRENYKGHQIQTREPETQT